jgi:hypothetical protein
MMLGRVYLQKGMNPQAWQSFSWRDSSRKVIRKRLRSLDIRWLFQENTGKPGQFSTNCWNTQSTAMFRHMM